MADLQELRVPGESRPLLPMFLRHIPAVLPGPRASPDRDVIQPFLGMADGAGFQESDPCP